MKNPTEVLKDGIEDGLASASEHAKSYVEAGANALNAASGKARRISRTADGYVHDYPWVAIGAAAGVGVLIGFLLRGSRDS